MEVIQRKKKIRIMIASILLLVVLGGIYLHCLYQKFPQKEIPLTDLYGEDNQNLKDFQCMEEGLLSTSSDPWIEYHLGYKTDIRVIELEFADVSVPNMWGEIFDMDTGKSHSYNLGSGRILVSYKDEDRGCGIKNFRFDLVSAQDVYFQIKKVVLNARYGIFKEILFEFLRMGFILLILEALLFAAIEKIKSGSKKKNGVWLMLTLYIFQIGLYIYNVSVVHVETSVQIWMYLLLISSAIMAIIALKASKYCWQTRWSCVAVFLILNIGLLEIMSGVTYDFKDLSAGFWNIILAGALVWLFSFFAMGRLKTSLYISNALFFALGIINHYFYQFRGNPFELSDIQMAQTAFTVLKNYQLKIDSILLFCVCMEVCIVLSIRLTDIRIAKDRKEIHADLLLGALLCMSAFVNAPEVSYWNVGATSREVGYLNSFFAYARKDFDHKKPEGYSLNDVQEILGRYHETKDTKTPNIIVIMNESFADLPEVYGFETKVDSMPFIHALNENTVKGNMLVSVFGGTTANTEYEFLTGNTMAFFSDGNVPYMQCVKRKQDSIVWRLRRADYQTLAFHPYTGENYNRDKVYPLLGFESYLSIEDDLPYKETLRTYVSDDSDVEDIIDLYEKRDPDEPFFLFNVTMQNHGGYSQYESQVDATVKPLKKELQQISLIEYLNLVKKSDEAFEKLVSYFENAEEETIILMFGDHQPGLDTEIYDAMDANLYDSLEERMKLYTVPFVMWANFEIDSEESVLTSPNYLRAILLQKAGMSLSCYEQFLLECKEEYPAMNAFGYYDSKGSLHAVDEAVDEEMLKEYYILQYANVYDRIP